MAVALDRGNRRKRLEVEESADMRARVVSDSEEEQARQWLGWAAAQEKEREGNGPRRGEMGQQAETEEEM
jgi:hypothetical protein